MKWIVITAPEFIEREAELIDRLFVHGLDILHLRKPGSDITGCRRLLDRINNKWRAQIVVHDHFSLCREYRLRGVHLNGRNPQPPLGHEGTVSRSCHSFEEIAKYKASCNYTTLSPIFNSISKQGYMSPFTPPQLLSARANGLIDNKVIALGGITLQNIPQVREYGFGGAAILGDVWQRMADKGVDEYLDHMRSALE